MIRDDDMIEHIDNLIDLCDKKIEKIKHTKQILIEFKEKELKND
jgi:hypothetical protein